MQLQESVHALAMTSAEGVPSRSVMSSSWCTTLRPGNRGLPSKISAKMQPMDQMSMAVEYFAKKDPQSSGARYLRSHEHLLKELLAHQSVRSMVQRRGNMPRLPECDLYRVARLSRAPVLAWSLPSRCDIVCPEDGGWHVVEGWARQSKVTHLELAVSICQDVLWLQVSVKDFGCKP